MWYKIDYDRLGILLLPSPLRQNKIVSYVLALFSPIKKLYEDWLDKRDFDWYRLQHDGRTFKLEKLLNRELDTQEKRIRIDVGSAFPRKYIFTNNEKKPKYLGKLHLNTQHEYLTKGCDFVVHVPQTIRNSPQDMATLEYLLKYYKLAGKRYKIEVL